MTYLRSDIESHIMSIAVDPAYRGNGIGSALLSEVIERLIKLYERFHFKRIKRIIGYCADGEDIHYMLMPAEEWGGGVE